jgi:hypothetical protein
MSFTVHTERRLCHPMNMLDDDAEAVGDAVFQSSSGAAWHCDTSDQHRTRYRSAQALRAFTARESSATANA